MSVLVVTGTGTGVGKTIVTAALASRFAAKRGHRVAVVTPARTGVAPGEPGDLAEVTRLSGVTDTHEYARYPDPLPPHQAAAVSGQPELELADVVRRIVDLDAIRDTVIVDGIGGLLTPFASGDRWTLVDLAASLRAPVLVVTGTGFDDVNHTALTVGRLAEDGITLAGIVIGSLADAGADLATLGNVADLAALGPEGKLAGAMREGMASLPPVAFRHCAKVGLARRFGGTFAPGAFAEAMRTTLRNRTTGDPAPRPAR